MRKDIAFAIRTLRRTPIFTTVAVLSLALGIGANTAIFSLLDQVILRSLPVRDPERLVVLHTDYSRNGHSGSDNYESTFSYPTYRGLRDRDAAFSGLIARARAGVTISWQGVAEAASAEVVSGNFFQVLGVAPSLGRLFTAEDDGAPGAHPVVVLNHGYWTSRFAASPAILSQTMLVNGHPMVVIGVAEPGFHGVISGATRDIFVPIAMQKAMLPTLDILADQEYRWLNVFGRLQPGLSLAKAQAAHDVAYRAEMEAEIPREKQMGQREREQFLNHRVQLRPAAQGINALRRQWEKPLGALMVMVGLVLLIACANVAGLTLARAAARQREIAVRLAIGAGRWALMRQLLVEGVVLAAAGGVLGLLVGLWGVGALLQVLPRDYAGHWLTATLNYRMLLFNLAVSLAGGVLFGLTPVLQATRADVAGVLKDQAASVAGGAARFRRALVTVEVALSLLLVVGAGLFTKSLRNLLEVQLGFRTQRLLMLNVNASLSRHEVAAANQFYREIEERFAAIPGVAGVGASDTGPFSGSDRGGNMTVEGYQARPNEYVGGGISSINPDYFRALGIPLRAGREFNQRDAAGAPKTVIVNETFARKYFGQAGPLGKRLMYGASNKPVLDREIVGVAADTRDSLHDSPKPRVFMPYPQWDRPERLSFYVRVSGDETAAAAAIRRVVREADANVPVANITPIEVGIRDSIYAERLIAILSGAFGLLATLLAAIGLYGVVSYAVARRTAEIGIRMALGALPRDVLRMVLWDAGRMAGGGIVLGLAGAIGLTRLVESQLFGVRPLDPLILAAAAALLAAIAAAAALAPGWRASRINPVAALKYE